MTVEEMFKNKKVKYGNGECTIDYFVNILGSVFASEYTDKGKFEMDLRECVDFNYYYF